MKQLVLFSRVDDWDYRSPVTPLNGAVAAVRSRDGEVAIVPSGETVTQLGGPHIEGGRWVISLREYPGPFPADQFRRVATPP